MIRKFDLEVTRYINAISQLRLKVHNDSLTLKNYEIKREQFQQNRIFEIMLLSFTRNRMEETRKRIYHQIQMKLQDFGGISAVYDRSITMMLSDYKV